MKNLATRLAGEFDAAVRKRGQNYYWQGHVRVKSGTDSLVEAHVRGSRNYEVSLRWENGDLTAFCQCPYFDSNGACKHLWATILAADARGFLRDAAAAAELSINYEDDDSLDDDPDYYEDEEASGFQLRPPRVAAPPKAPALPPPPPSWRNQIAEIAEKPGGMPQYSSEWPAKRQILYIVDFAGSA